jgi:hypothetical protein
MPGNCSGIGPAVIQTELHFSLMGHCLQETALFAFSLTWLKAVKPGLVQIAHMNWQEMGSRKWPRRQESGR